MNPFVRDRINELRKSDDNNDHDRATMMEMLCTLGEEVGEVKKEVSAVKVQTTLTNGRVTKHDGILKTLDERTVALELPAGEIKTVCKVVAKAAAIAVTMVGITAGIVTVVSAKSTPTKEEIKKIVDQTLLDAKPQKGVNP